eukprot:scaffold19780_cov17-Tisochrysis_lutea.AAC.3
MAHGIGSFPEDAMTQHHKRRAAIIKQLDLDMLKPDGQEQAGSSSPTFSLKTWIGTQARIRGGDLFFMVDMPEGNFYSLCLLCLNTKIETFLDNSNMFGFGWVGELVCPCCHLPLLVPFALRA